MCFFHCTFIYLLLRSPGRPTAANDGQRRPTKTKKGHKSQPRVVRHHVSRLQHTHHTFGPDDAHEGLRRPPAAKKANPGPRRGKRAQRYLRYVFFLLYIYLFITTKPGKAHSSQRRPTQAHEDEKGPQITTSCGSSPRQPAATHPPHLWPGRRPRRPTKAPSSQEGQPRPMKRKKGPKVPKVRVFFIVHLFIYYYEAREGPQQPTMANAGPRRRKRATNHHLVWFVTTSAGCNTPTTPLARTTPTMAYEGQPRPMKRKKGPKVPKVRVFFIVHLFIYYYEAWEGPQQPTMANAGPRRRKRATNHHLVSFVTTSAGCNTPTTPLARTTPTKAYEGQPRPTKRKKGSKVPKVRVFFSFSVLLTTKAHSSPRRPTQATAGQRRPMQAHKDEKRPKRRQARRLGPR